MNSLSFLPTTPFSKPLNLRDELVDAAVAREIQTLRLRLTWRETMTAGNIKSDEELQKWKSAQANVYSALKILERSVEKAHSSLGDDLSSHDQQIRLNAYSLLRYKAEREKLKPGMMARVQGELGQMESLQPEDKELLAQMDDELFWRIVEARQNDDGKVALDNAKIWKERKKRAIKEPKTTRKPSSARAKRRKVSTDREEEEEEEEE